MDEATILGSVIGLLLAYLLDSKELPVRTMNDKLNYFCLWITLIILINISVKFLSYISYCIIDLIKILF
jgi:hypothetical protein